MNSVDISALGNLQPAQPIDLSVIPEAPKKAFVFPRSGKYTVRAPEAITSDNFRKTKADNLSARVDPTIVGPTNEGFEVRFTDISAKNYTDPRSNLETSQVAQYLQAFGVTDELSGDPQQAADLIASTAGKTAEVILEWVAEHRASGFKLRGMRNFPPDGNGGFQSFVTMSEESGLKDAQGEPLRLRANLYVSRWLPLKSV